MCSKQGLFRSQANCKQEEILPAFRGLRLHGRIGFLSTVKNISPYETFANHCPPIVLPPMQMIWRR